LADTKISALAAITTIATGDELAVNDAGASKKITYENVTRRTELIPCVMEVSEGVIAYPDVDAMTTTANKKITGFIMPDGATASDINFKCKVPVNIHTTPAASILFIIKTMGTVAGPADVRLTVSTMVKNDAEDIDVGFTAETETTVTMPVTDDTLDYYDQDLTTDPAADDFILGQLKRDPVDAADDFTADIQIIGIYLKIDTIGAS